MLKNLNNNMKTIINESSKIDLNKAKSMCFNKWITKGILKNEEPQLKQYSNGKIFILAYDKTDPNLSYHFYDDMTYIGVKDNKRVAGESGDWSCNISQIEGEKTAADLKAKQDAYITKLKTVRPEKQYYTNDDREEMKLRVANGEYQELDLNTLSDALFPEKGKYFIYEPISKVPTKMQTDIIQQFKTAKYEEVDCDTPLTDEFATPILKLHQEEKYKNYFAQPYCMVVKRDFTLDPSEWNKFLEDNYSFIINDLNNTSKQRCRQVISNYEVAMDKKLAIQNSGYLQPLKTFIQACASQHNFHAGTKKALQKIMVSRKNRYGNYALNESLTNRIKNNLLEVKENKKNFLVETHIVQNRFKLIVESSNPKNKKIIYDRLISEIIKLKSTGISDKVISEQLEGLFNMFKGLFGGDKAGSNIMGGIGGTFVEYGVQFLLRFIGLDPNSVVGRIFVTSIGNIGGFENIPKILTDCKFTSELLAKSIVESMAGSFIDNNIGTGFLADSLRNVFTDVAFSTDMVKTIQSKISDKVCEALGSLDSKAESVTKEIKQKALS
jgi:hypothetical protein